MTRPAPRADADGPALSGQAGRICLKAEGIRKSFGTPGDKQTVALADIGFTVSDGEFLSIVGPSGCGKSTLLQIVAGLIRPTGGQVSVDGRVIDGPPDGVVYLFQQYSRSLFPWRTALENVAFAVEHRHSDRGSARELARSYLDMVGLDSFGDHYPRQLSGGMQQRVVIARALAAEPRVLLLDEPFSSVDALTRIDLHNLVLELHRRYRFTAVLVTHDVEEAIFLADRVAVLSARPGVVLHDIPTELQRPRDAITTRESPRFIELRHRLLGMLLGRSA